MPAWFRRSRRHPAIGYVVSFHEDVANGIGTAALRSYDGEFLLPTPQAIEAAAAALWPRTPQDERLTLVNARRAPTPTH